MVVLRHILHLNVYRGHPWSTRRGPARACVQWLRPRGYRCRVSKTVMESANRCRVRSTACLDDVPSCSLLGLICDGSALPGFVAHAKCPALLKSASLQHGDSCVHHQHPPVGSWYRHRLRCQLNFSCMSWLTCGCKWLISIEQLTEQTPTADLWTCHGSTTSASWIECRHGRRTAALIADCLLHPRTPCYTPAATPQHHQHIQNIEPRRWASCVVLAVGFQAYFCTLPSCGPTAPQP